jgi:hypothetical protein
VHGTEHKEADYEENGDVWSIGDRVHTMKCKTSPLPLIGGINDEILA